MALALGSALAASAAHAQTQPAWADSVPFTGPVVMQFSAPGKTTRTEQGTGAARWVPDGAGGVRFELHADEPRTATSVRFSLDGRTQTPAWQSVPNAIRLAVAPDGRITGGGIDHTLQRTMRFTGMVSGTDLLLQILTTFERAEGPLPAGMQLLATYTLQREAPTAVPDAPCTQGMAIIPSHGTGQSLRGICR